MEAVKATFSEVAYYTLKENAENVQVPELTPAAKKLIEGFDVMGKLLELGQMLATPTLIQNLLEAAQKIEAPVARGVDGILETANREGRSMKKAIARINRVVEATNAADAQALDLEPKATKKLRQQLVDQSIHNDELYFELRPSQYPNIMDPKKLIPEKRRAAQNKARRQLENESKDATPESINERILDENFDISPRDIDQAFIQLKNEGLNVDRQDLILRAISYTRMKSAQAYSRSNHVAITSRTIVPMNDVEMYAKLASAQVKKLFGITKFSDLIERFEGIPAEHHKRIHSIQDVKFEEKQLLICLLLLVAEETSQLNLQIDTGYINY